MQDCLLCSAGVNYEHKKHQEEIIWGRAMNVSTPHRRLNLLTNSWVLVSPQRTKRPWLGQVEKTPPENLPAYDPGCYLCPGNPRAAGRVNPAYNGVYVFDNDFPALLKPEEIQPATPVQTTSSPLLMMLPEHGLCRVACFSARHDLTLPELSQAEVEQVVQAWSAQTQELGALAYIRYVQVFENKGALMGCSNPHPHSQIWAVSNLPDEPARELQTQRDYLKEHHRCLLCDYLSTERQAKSERLVCENEHFSALVPFWATWPFEILLISHRHAGSLPDLTPAEVSSLADILRQVTTRYDNLFEISFPYSMGFHQAPFDDDPHPEWHLHAHFYPPLLRSATVRKFMVGYEMLAMPQRDLTPETAAERLRQTSTRHYKHS